MQNGNLQAKACGDGKFVFTVGEETKTVSAGDALYIAPDLLHDVTCTEEDELIDVFSPCREDFLQ